MQKEEEELKDIQIQLPNNTSPNNPNPKSPTKTGQKKSQNCLEKFLLDYIIRPIFKYLTKFLGAHESSGKQLSFSEACWAVVGIVLSLGAISALHFLLLEPRDYPLLQASFGATAILLFAAPESQFAQPKNVIGGQAIGAFVGVCCSVIFENFVYLGTWVSVCVTLIAMVFTKTVHPPAGTTALIMILGSDKLKKLEFMFILMPTLSGTVIMVILALILNNLQEGKVYPRTWWH